MTTKIIAKTSSFTDDGYTTLLSFADDPDAPARYVILSITNEPDEQDLELRLQGVHIDTGPLRVEGYDLVEDVWETAKGVVIKLTAVAAQDAGIDQNVEILMQSKTVDGVAVGDAVARFRNRLDRPSP